MYKCSVCGKEVFKDNKGNFIKSCPHNKASILVDISAKASGCGIVK